MLANELPGTGYDAAEVLGPRLIGGRVNQDMTNLLLPQYLRVGWTGHESVDLLLYKEALIVAIRVYDPVDVLWAQANVCRKH
jgi:hypothetical protein